MNGKCHSRRLSKDAFFFTLLFYFILYLLLCVRGMRVCRDVEWKWKKERRAFGFEYKV